jgi:hypothetical protein
MTLLRHAYTTDIDTTVSDLKTVFTESMAAQSKMLETFMQTSHRQQQQLMEATQSQQATTNQLLQTLSSLMASMVPGANSPATTGSHPPSQSSAPSSDTAMQNTRPAPSDSPVDSHKDSSPPASDTDMSNAENHQDQDPDDPDAATPLLDPDPGRRS